MELQEYLDRMASGEPIRGGGELHKYMRQISEESMRLLSQLNTGYHAQKEVRDLMTRIIGKQVPATFRLFPPFYTNCGKNITLGERVFINAGCHLQDQGGITIGSGCILGNNVILTTLNHDFDPTCRSTTYPAPIRLGENVWIGSGAIILPGVTIGSGSIVGAGSVVTRNVPENTIVAGSPARIIRKIQPGEHAPSTHREDP